MKKWFREHETSFSPMDWPSQILDLNPGENLWDLRVRVRVRGSKDKALKD